MTVDTSLSTPAPGAHSYPAGTDADGKTTATEAADGTVPVAPGGAGDEGMVPIGGRFVPHDAAVRLLFLEQGHTFTGMAKDRLDYTKELMGELRKLNTMISRMRAHKNDGVATVPPDMMQFRAKHGMCTGIRADNVNSSGEWDQDITTTQGIVDKARRDVELAVTKLKSIVSSLNSAISGAASTFDKKDHVAKEVVSDS